MGKRVTRGKEKLSEGRLPTTNLNGKTMPKIKLVNRKRVHQPFPNPRFKDATTAEMKLLSLRERHGRYPIGRRQQG
jgi:hypothetical protein